MQPITITSVALNQTPLDWSGNLERIRSAITESRREGATLVCLPELAITGYGCEDAFFAENTCRRAWSALRDLLPFTEGLVVSVGLPIRHAGAIYNAAALVVDGRIAGLVAKKNLAGDGIHYEPRWFKAWPEGVRDDYHGDEQQIIPIGDLLIDVGGVRIGFEICEDAWVAKRPGASLASLGVDVVLNPSASHFAFGKAEVRRGFVSEGSRAFQCIYVYANLLGNEAGRVIYDGQLMIAENGTLVAESPRFGFHPFRTLTATVDLANGRLARIKSVSQPTRLPLRDEDRVLPVAFLWPQLAPNTSRSINSTRLDKCEEFTRAVTLALHDYHRKSGSSGYVVSLSGGADSAAVACLVKLMRDLALNDLGPDAYPNPLSATLITAYQATEHSSEATRHAAFLLAESLGCAHLELDVSTLHHGFVSMIEDATATPLNWENHDISLQNIQARVRAPGVWMLANLRNAILLATSNRSEAAVGYATMDGDTAGGLAPIAGIDKAFLLEWLHWLETTGPLIQGERHPIPALEAVNLLKPTAELRPEEKHQTDEHDLMPYLVLDFIERAAIRDQRTPSEVSRLVAERFPKFTSDQIKTWTKRFFTLWSRNQWKRERYAPGFHLDDENLDPKTWCRWPILSGGFQQELSEL